MPRMQTAVPLVQPPTLQPQRRLQALIDAATPGSVVRVPRGLYREQATVTKGLTLQFEQGAEVRGSDVWTGWQQNGPYWMQGTVPDFFIWQDETRCRADAQGMCLRAEQVFLDGVPLRPVPDNPLPGQFSVTPERWITLADDPTGRQVEVTTRRFWLVAGAGGVTVDGLTARHAANDLQFGALSNHNRDTLTHYNNWTVRNCYLRHTHGNVVYLGNGHTGAPATGLLIEDCDLGFGGHGSLSVSQSDGAIVRRVKAHHGNHWGYTETGWGSGAFKGAVNTNLLVEDSDFYRSDGLGLWMDIDCNNVTFRRCRSWDNTGPGIFYEISFNALIEDCVSYRNGHRWQPGWMYGSGIAASSSENVEIRRCLSAWDADGINMFWQERPDAQSGGGYWMHDNLVILGQYPPGAGSQFQSYAMGLYGGAGNHGENNHVWYPAPEDGTERFWWDGTPYATLAGFMGSPGGGGDTRYLTDGEARDRLVAAGVPLGELAR